MTQTTTAGTTCPQCGAAETVAMSDGTRLCLSCRNEYDPTTAPPFAQAQLPPALEPVSPPGDNVDAQNATAPQGAPTAVGDVLGPPAEIVAEREAQAALDAMIGTQVVLEGGQVARVRGFPDDDHMTVSTNDDDKMSEWFDVDLNDVVRSVDTAPVVVDVDDDTARALAAVNVAVAGLVLRAGVATLAGDDDNVQLITPPTGWLPLDADALPALEQGVAYAVAVLLFTFKIDREMVAEIATQLMADSQDEQPTKGGDEQ